jgi:hypothetical protein
MVTTTSGETSSLSTNDLEIRDKDSPSSVPSIHQIDQAVAPSATPDEVRAGYDFKPTWRFYMTFISISVITLAAALDATSMATTIRTSCNSI